MERKQIITESGKILNKINDASTEMSETGFIRKSVSETSFETAVTWTKILIDKFSHIDSPEYPIPSEFVSKRKNIASSSMLPSAVDSQKPESYQHTQTDADSHLNMKVETSVEDGSPSFHLLFRDGKVESIFSDIEVHKINRDKIELNVEDFDVALSLKEKCVESKSSDINKYLSKKFNLCNFDSRQMSGRQDDNYSDMDSNVEFEIDLKISNKSTSRESESDLFFNKPTTAVNGEKSETITSQLISRVCSCSDSNYNREKNNKLWKNYMDLETFFTQDIFAEEDDFSWLPPDVRNEDKDILVGSVRCLVNYFKNRKNCNFKKSGTLLQKAVKKNITVSKEEDGIKLSPERKIMHKLTVTSEPLASKQYSRNNILEVRKLQDYSLRNDVIEIKSLEDCGLRRDFLNKSKTECSDFHLSEDTMSCEARNGIQFASSRNLEKYHYSGKVMEGEGMNSNIKRKPPRRRVRILDNRSRNTVTDSMTYGIRNEDRYSNSDTSSFSNVQPVDNTSKSVEKLSEIDQTVTAKSVNSSSTLVLKI